MTVRRVGDNASSDQAVAAATGQHPTAALVGPCYDTAGLSRLLGADADVIGEHVQAHTLLGCRTEGGSWRYPALQFDEHGRTIAHLREVLDLLLAGTDDSRRWRAARWLAAPAPYLPHAVSAAQWLRDGGDPEPVLAAARADARRWAV